MNMKLSAYAALCLPFVLLLVLVTSVIMMPRIDAARPISNVRSAAPHSRIVDLPEIQVRVDAAPAAAGHAGWGTGSGAARGRAAVKPLLRMPYYSFADDLIPSAGH
jgi:hypothetical protein